MKYVYIMAINLFTVMCNAATVAIMVAIQLSNLRDIYKPEPVAKQINHAMVHMQRVQSERFESTVEPAHETDYDEIISKQLPRYGVLCKSVYVHGNPQGDYPLYRLEVGTQLRLREMYSTFNNPAWVMVKPAEWIPMSALCSF